MTADVHENFAKETFARCWDLLGRSLNDAEKRDLVGYALTSRYHWQQVGGGQQLAIADWMASRAYAAVGQPALAVAYASAGDHQLRDKYVARALTELEKEPAPEDAGLIRNQIEELLDD
jgi:hypothetical protein